MSDDYQISDLPFPVAYPLYWALDGESKLAISGRRRNAIFTVYQAMRLTALLMLADYLEDPGPGDPNLAN